MNKNYNFWTYIVTNAGHRVMYTGVTNNLAQRLKEHYDNRGDDKTFAGRYNCHNLVYCEYTTYINNAILREKEIKNLSRAKKIAMINAVNPSWRFLNIDVCGAWPPTFGGRLKTPETDALTNREDLAQKLVGTLTTTETDDEWWVGLTPPFPTN